MAEQAKPATVRNPLPLIIALDMPSADDAYRFTQNLALPGVTYKIGLELLFTGGMPLAQRLLADGYQVFIDAKLFDIGNTVSRATAAISALGATFLTVHAQDTAILEAAQKAAEPAGVKLLGITLLTSIAPETLREDGIALTPAELVLRRAKRAQAAGLAGAVCSPQEVALLRSELPHEFLLVTPGVRPAAASPVKGDDQARTATPAAAIRAGANYVVVGRPILQAADPAIAARAILSEIEEAKARA